MKRTANASLAVLIAGLGAACSSQPSGSVDAARAGEAARSAPAADAPPASATYLAVHQIEVTPPAGAQAVRAWITVPQEEPDQKVADLKVEAPVPHRITIDSQGNRALFVEVNNPKGPFKVTTTFTVTRSEVRHPLDGMKSRPLSAEEKEAHRRDLDPSRYIVIDEGIRKLSADITKGLDDPIAAARRIYDWEIENIDYWVKDPVHHKASPVGSSEYCLTNKTGNCSDFHSLWASLARAAGIPCRIVYGSVFKKELDGKDEDLSYHCWIEFWVPEHGWIPLDASMADIFRGDFPTTKENEVLVRRATPEGYHGAEPDRVSYYFGNLEDRRVTFSRGRDLEMDPPQSGPPVNALIKAYVEADGKSLAEKDGWTRKLTYREAR